MKIMFWNTNRNVNINQAICDIAWENRINIIVLAEYRGDIEHLIERLAQNNVYMRQYFSLGCEKIVILGNVADVQSGRQQNRYSFQNIQNKYILCAMHLPSQIYSGQEDRRKIVIKELIEDLQNYERELGTKRSILVGDINEDPYDDGCLSANNFHGLPSKNDALREQRIIEGKSFAMFYNPMWNFFGDFTSPPGTYYYPGSNVKNAFWHIFDQVMIRPCLKDEFVEDSLTIVTKAATKSLLDKDGHPNKDLSDHLPIIFELREER